jgi:ABC-type lipoprotein export system ATPase subunit
MIKVQNLHKTHINSRTDRVKALTDVSFELPDTGFVLFSGKSGSGKTTMLSILGCLDKFDSGTYTINGRVVGDFKAGDADRLRSHDTAFIFQDFNLIPNYTVAANLALARNMQGCKVGDDEIETVLKYINMDGFQDRYPADLSGGERQRIAIARALLKTPKVLFVDEPTGQLDQENAMKILELLKTISKTLLVVCVSHQEFLVEKYIDHIVRFERGRVVYSKAKKRRNEKPKRKKKTADANNGLNFSCVPDKGTKAKVLFNFGLQNIAAQKGKSVLFIILASLSFLFFSVFFMLQGYDQNMALARAAKTGGILQAEIGAGTVPVADPAALGLGAGTVRYYDADWVGEIGGFIEIAAPSNNTVGGKNALGQEILYGKYLAAADSVVITDYIADKVFTGAIRFLSTGGSTVPLDDGDALIGNQIQLDRDDGAYVTVSGIVKTDFKTADPKAADYNYKLENIYRVVHAADSNFISAYHTADGLMRIDNTVVTAGSGAGTRQITASVGRLSSNPNDDFWLSRASEGHFITPPGGQEDLNFDGSFELLPGQILISQDIYHANGVNPRMFIDGIEVNINIGDPEVDKPDGYTVVATFVPWPGEDSAVYFSSSDFLKTGGGVAVQILHPLSKLFINVSDFSDTDLAALISKVNASGLSFIGTKSNDIYSFSEKINTFKSALLLFSIFSLFFAAVLLYSFISALIESCRRTVGVLRSLGASSRDTALILFTTVAIFGLACFLLSSVLSLVTSLIVNSLMAGTMGVAFELFVLSPPLFLWILLTAFAVSFASTVYPIVRYASQTPFKQLKQR